MPTPFTQADLEYRAGADGVELRLDDDPTNGLTEIQADAMAELDYYLAHRYDTTTDFYFANTWIKACLIACGLWLLCQRRFNSVPDALQKRWDGFQKKLEAILSGNGNASVPGLAERKANVPVMSNHRVRLWPYPQALPQRQHSTGTPEGYTRTDDRLEPPAIP